MIDSITTIGHFSLNECFIQFILKAYMGKRNIRVIAVSKTCVEASSCSVDSALFKPCSLWEGLDRNYGLDFYIGINRIYF